MICDFWRFFLIWGILGGPNWSPPHPHPRRQCQSSLPGEKYERKLFFVMIFYGFYGEKLKKYTKVITSCSIRRVAFVVSIRTNIIPGTGK